ncbi:NADH:ubiquinone oxidoreductase complex I intermediate-associated protein 30 [Terfezia boudieri ATCC MYA-4762]|uniref:NADH:ubiquinone oxidoreductase complex I intermediate-associated protein 30 n=1 Tax=Terfezia boudieri ATCC MYA-4762 TaxID=1051890 RepID=A0A3N4LQ54_9PEZI|nr:NADH:ubiquinone oxidoreductase complex I intermediate-associated protein 30 [Terfezia boudieri ATCC MYA-4762]
MSSKHPNATREELGQRTDLGIMHSVKMTAPIVYSAPVTGYHVRHHRRFDLFGGSKPWDKTEWTAQDDRLRGGISTSHLTIHPIPGSSLDSPGTIATFYGNLDTKTLGGAGFASQRTVGDDRRWDLNDYYGIEVVVLIPPSNTGLIELDDEPTPAPIKERIYTIVVKDCIIRGEPDAGKEISWEWNFKPKFGKEELEEAEHHHKKGPVKQYFKANWGDFKAFYRGRPVDVGKRLDVGRIKRVSIMIRSFFQEQQDGDFSVSLVSISAVGGGEA